MAEIVRCSCLERMASGGLFIATIALISSGVHGLEAVDWNPVEI